VVMNNNYLYVRDKSYPSAIIDIWENFKKGSGAKGDGICKSCIHSKQSRVMGFHSKDICYGCQFSCEPATSYFVDLLNDGWIGHDEWLKRYEPVYAKLHRFSPYKVEQVSFKKDCFIHKR